MKLSHFYLFRFLLSYTNQFILFTFIEMEPDNVRPPDHVQNMRLMEENVFHEVVEEDPELEFAIAMSIASYEESIQLYTQMVENESPEKVAEKILMQKQIEDEKRKETEREKRRLYKESLKVHFDSLLVICRIWNRLPDMKSKASMVEKIVNRYYQEMGVYLYLSEEEYYTFYDILREMQDETKNRNPLRIEHFMKVEEHIRLLE